MDGALITTLTIALIVFVPMIVILWFTFRAYSYPYTTYTYFDDRKVAIMLAIGIGVGMVFSICYLFFDLRIVSYALIFAVLEEAVRVVVLNYPRFQLKFDTTFYGFAFGLGIGSVIMIAVSYITSSTTDILSPSLITILTVYSFTFALFYSSTGAVIGFGCYKGRVWTYTGWVIILHILYNMVLIPFRATLAPIYYYPSIIVALLISLIVYSHAYINILPNSLPDSLRRRRMREIRKKRRKAKRF